MYKYVEDQIRSSLRSTDCFDRRFIVFTCLIFILIFFKLLFFLFYSFHFFFPTRIPGSCHDPDSSLRVVLLQWRRGDCKIIHTILGRPPRISILYQSFIPELVCVKDTIKLVVLLRSFLLFFLS